MLLSLQITPLKGRPQAHTDYCPFPKIYIDQVREERVRVHNAIQYKMQDVRMRGKISSRRLMNVIINSPPPAIVAQKRKWEKLQGIGRKIQAGCPPVIRTNFCPNSCSERDFFVN